MLLSAIILCACGEGSGECLPICTRKDMPKPSLLTDATSIEINTFFQKAYNKKAYQNFQMLMLLFVVGVSMQKTT